MSMFNHERSDMDTHEATDQSAGDEVRAEATRAAAENENVRERVRRMVVDTVRERNLGLGAMGDLARQAVDGAVQGVRELTPEQRDSVLRQVVDGVGDAFSSAAQATRLAMEEAQGRGERFAKEDVQNAVRHLSELQRVFTETILNTLEQARHEASSQTKDFIEHARRVSDRIGPSIDSALQAATRHPGKLVSETATAAAKGAPKAAGMLLHAMSGVLQGAGDLLAGAGKPTSEEKTS